MKPSPVAVSIGKKFESLALKAYPDPASPRGLEAARPHSQRKKGWETLPGDPWTIGFGHTGPDVYEGLVITEAQAEQTYLLDLDRFGDGVEKILAHPELVLVSDADDMPAPVVATQNEFDALVLFAFNEGLGDPNDHEHGLWGSTLMRKYLMGDKAGAAYEFDRWVRAGGRIMGGLVRRRKAERALFEGRYGQLYGT